MLSIPAPYLQNMLDSLCQSDVITTQNKVELALLILQTASSQDKLLSVHLNKLLKSVQFEDNQYLYLISEIVACVTDNTWVML